MPTKLPWFGGSSPTTSRSRYTIRSSTHPAMESATMAGMIAASLFRPCPLMVPPLLPGATSNNELERPPVGTATCTLDTVAGRSEEHTSELQSRETLVCRLLLETKKEKQTPTT